MYIYVYNDPKVDNHVNGSQLNEVNTVINKNIVVVK